MQYLIGGFRLLPSPTDEEPDISKHPNLSFTPPCLRTYYVHDKLYGVHYYSNVYDCCVFFAEVNADGDEWFNAYSSHGNMLSDRLESLALSMGSCFDVHIDDVDWRLPLVVRREFDVSSDRVILPVSPIGSHIGAFACRDAMIARQMRYDLYKDCYIDVWPDGDRKNSLLRAVQSVVSPEFFLTDPLSVKMYQKFWKAWYIEKNIKDLLGMNQSI